jgi:hypothetical protein
LTKLSSTRAAAAKCSGSTAITGASHSATTGARIDFRDLPFPDSQFKLVVFDPPHLRQAGKSGWQAKKYGILSDDWKSDLRLGFSECFRVLARNGVLIFKWNEMQIRLREILALTDQQPLFGHRTGKHSMTHWVAFLKMA